MVSSCLEHAREELLGMPPESFRLPLLADHVPILIWSAGLDKGGEYFNEAWLEFRGRTLEQEIGCGWLQGIHPDDVAHCISTRDTAFDNRKSFQVEYRLLRRDFRYRWVLETGAPRFQPGGVFHGYVSSCVDIHDYTQQQDELKRVNDALSLQLKELSEFTYAACHDLREPLRTIACFTSLEKRQSREPGQLDLMPAVLESVRRMEALINDVFLYSRVLQGTELTITDLDCNALVDQILLSCLATIEDSKALVTHDVLPAVYADEGQLGRVFQNLIGNAIKYGRSNQQPRIHISAAAVDDDWRFEVADNGIGFDPEYSNYIFLPLKRLHGRREYSGSGMGLAICKRIVERHGGRIWATSVPELGSHFFFTLPRDSQHALMKQG